MRGCTIKGIVIRAKQGVFMLPNGAPDSVSGADNTPDSSGSPAQDSAPVRQRTQDYVKLANRMNESHKRLIVALSGSSGAMLKCGGRMREFGQCYSLLRTKGD